MVLTAVLLLGAGCRKGGTQTTIRVYYLNSTGTGLVSREYHTESDSAGMIVDELITCLVNDPEDTDWKAPISAFTLLKTTLDDTGLLTLHFSGEYADMEVVREALVRTAIVSTLGSVEGVEGVAFTVDGKALKDENGRARGTMRPSEFIFNTGTEMRGYEKVRVHLYFASEDGKSLVDTWRTVFYNSNVPMERMIVEQVLAGTDSDVAFPTLNEETQIISVTTRGDICYVNLNRTFLEQPYDVTPAVAIYSLVDSLTELSSVTQVQITVEGDQKTVFMDSVSLNTTFRRDLTLVQNTPGQSWRKSQEEQGE